MQILIAWQAANLSPEDAERRWQAALGAWQARYQALLTGQRLQAHATSAGLLFCGLLAQPGLFRAWQEWHEDSAWGLAWSGLAHNLVDVLPPRADRSSAQRLLDEYEARGAACFEELDGRFVAAILDKRRRRLAVAANVQGQSPCFQTEGKYGAAVGTRIAPLLDLVGRPVVPRPSAMMQVITMDWVLNRETVFDGVFQVEAGAVVLLDEHQIAAQPHASIEAALARAEALRRDDYLAQASDAVTTAVRQQFRHAAAPLVDLTGGMDSRAIAASIAFAGFQPPCDVSGLPNSREILLAEQAANALRLTLHQLHPSEAAAEQLEQTLGRWARWTEGMSPAHIAFSRSLLALSPAYRDFFANYTQVFNGGTHLGGIIFYGVEALAEPFSPEIAVTKLFARTARFAASFFSPSALRMIEDEIRAVIQEGAQAGLRGHRLIQYFYWRQGAAKWTGCMADMQQIGRHVFMPLCCRALADVSLIMTAEEMLTDAWHRCHIQRTMPSLWRIPFMAPPMLGGWRKTCWHEWPGLFKTALKIRQMTPRRPRSFKLPDADREKMGTPFHRPLEALLFSKDAWWPQVAPLEQGRMAWQRFKDGIEAKPVWNLVTIEAWARTFLAAKGWGA